jgi:hypothetical protein
MHRHSYTYYWLEPAIHFVRELKMVSCVVLQSSGSLGCF